MLLVLKNKETLKLDSFSFKCCVGKKGLNKFKKEGDGTTPIGTFGLGNNILQKRQGIKTCYKF